MKKILLAILLMAPLSIFAQKFAHFDLTQIIPNMKEYTAAQEELQKLQKQFEDDLKLMQDELQKKGEDYEKQKANLLDNVRQRRETELQELYNRLQTTFQDNNKILSETEQAKMQEIQKLVLDAVKKVGEAGGYVYIVDISTGAIPFVSPTLSTDVTPEIKKALGM